MNIETIMDRIVRNIMQPYEEQEEEEVHEETFGVTVILFNGERVHLSAANGWQVNEDYVDILVDDEICASFFGVTGVILGIDEPENVPQAAEV